MSLSERDKQVIWHPYTQMKTSGDCIAIERGEGAWLIGTDGKKYFDAISSWWTNLHGHAHPHIAAKVSEQLNKLEHVLFAGFTHEPAVSLAERLLKHLPSAHRKVFYSDNGSTAVEVALKMAFQYWSNQGAPRKKVIAFKNAYHGDTFGAMAVSGRSAFTGAFEELLFDVVFVEAPVPGKEEAAISELEAVLAANGGSIASFIFEPLVQGSAGMMMHRAASLDAMIAMCRKMGILIIADEVMTSFGRTGMFLACDQLKEQPDIVCLSKGITGGAMALGLTSCTAAIYDAFLSDDKMKTFFHGHSYTANPVACAAANASLDLMEQEETGKRIKLIAEKHAAFVRRTGLSSPHAFRQCGTILAIELRTKEQSSYFNSVRDKAYVHFLGKGILLRPLGNVIYLMPPYCTGAGDLDYIYAEIERFLNGLNDLPV